MSDSFAMLVARSGGIEGLMTLHTEVTGIMTGLNGQIPVDEGEFFWTDLIPGDRYSNVEYRDTIENKILVGSERYVAGFYPAMRDALFSLIGPHMLIITTDIQQLCFVAVVIYRDENERQHLLTIHEDYYYPENYHELTLPIRYLRCFDERINVITAIDVMRHILSAILITGRCSHEEEQVLNTWLHDVANTTLDDQVSLVHGRETVLLRSAYGYVRRGGRSVIISLDRTVDPRERIIEENQDDA